MTRGKFIVIDGGEGSGKSTVVKYLKDFFSPTEAVFTREPGGTPLAEMIRGVMLSDAAAKASAETQFNLIWAARVDHVRNHIEPLLARGIHVVTDRFDSTTYAYQIHGQEAPHLRGVFFQMRDICLGLTKPDLYLFLDVDPQIGLSRVAKRKSNFNHFDARDIDFHQRIRQGYLEFITMFPGRIIDASQKTEDGLAQVKETIEEYFASGDKSLPFGVCKLPVSILDR